MPRMNHHFVEMRRLVERWRDHPLNPELQPVVHEGWIKRDGCFLLATAAKHKTNATLSSFEDKTGYECFINHIHIDEYVASHCAEQAIRLVYEVLNQWKLRRHRGRLNAIATFADESAIVRFHYKRPGETWLAENLNGYQEAVLELPCSEIEFLTSLAR